jgi:hypothetical protein
MIPLFNRIKFRSFTEIQWYLERILLEYTIDQLFEHQKKISHEKEDLQLVRKINFFF